MRLGHDTEKKQQGTDCFRMHTVQVRVEEARAFCIEGTNESKRKGHDRCREQTGGDLAKDTRGLLEVREQGSILLDGADASGG